MTKTSLRLLPALLIAAGFAVAAVPSYAASPAEPAASAPDHTVRPETGPALKAAQERVQAHDWVGALAKLKEAEAVGNLTPYETYLITRMRAVSSYSAGDAAGAIKDFQWLLKSDQLPPNDKPAITEALIRILYAEKRYPEALALATEYQKAGGSNQEIIDLIPQMQYASGDTKVAGAAFQKQIDTEIAAGKVPAEKELRLLASSQYSNEDDAGYARTVERLAEYYPKREYWDDVVQRASHAPGTDKIRLDAVRLRSAILGYKDGSARLQHAYLADRGGYPAEAKPLFDEGIANKLFAANEMADATKARDGVAKAIAKDRASDKANESGARAAKEGDPLVAWGLEVFFDGQKDRGIALMQEGVAKGNLKQPAESKLHLGMALVMVGRYDDARKVLDPIAGAEGAGALARVWSLWAKVGGKFTEAPKQP
jgi:hypothetical protein